MSFIPFYDFRVDKESKEIHITRNFDANSELVWKAWTDPAILDQWWAPRPYKAVTVEMNCKDGGEWFYYMLSPEGERHYCLFRYIRVEDESKLDYHSNFTSPEKVINDQMPVCTWHNQFKSEGEKTRINITITYPTVEALETMIAMGFKGGFEMGLGNLDEYLATNR